jgi:predicted RNA-binding protein YlqC (UPF0109 family)
MSNIDQQFIEFVVKSLVGKPEAVSVERRIDEKGVLLELTVDPEDLGRVIGKRGATAQSLRTLLRALGTKNDARYNLKIVDNGVGSPGGDSESKPAPRPDKKSIEKTESKPEQAPGSDDSAKTDEPVKVEEPVAKAEDKPAPEEATSDRLRKAREELADLDDLDV